MFFGRYSGKTFSSIMLHFVRHLMKKNYRSIFDIFIDLRFYVNKRGTQNRIEKFVRKKKLYLGQKAKNKSQIC